MASSLRYDWILYASKAFMFTEIGSRRKSPLRCEWKIRGKQEPIGLTVKGDYASVLLVKAMQTQSIDWTFLLPLILIFFILSFYAELWGL